MMAKHDLAFGEARLSPFAMPANRLSAAVEAAVAQDMLETIPEEQKACGYRPSASPAGVSENPTVTKAQKRQEQVTARVQELMGDGHQRLVKDIAQTLGEGDGMIRPIMMNLCALGLMRQVAAARRNAPRQYVADKGETGKALGGNVEGDRG